MKKQNGIKSKHPSDSIALTWEDIFFWGGMAIAALVGMMGIYIMAGERDSGARIERLVEEVMYVDQLMESVTDLGKPGNDVLEQYAVNEEQVRLKHYRLTYKIRRTTLQREFSEKKAFIPLLEELDRHIIKLEKEIDSVFTAAVMREVRREEGASDGEVTHFETEAATAMARMDRQTNSARGVLKRMSKLIRAEQNEVFAFMSQLFYWICFLGLTAFASFIVGLFLLRRLGHAHKKEVVLKKHIGNVMSNISSGILVLSDELVILSANRSSRKMLYNNPDEMLKGKRLDEILPTLGLDDMAKEVLLSKTAREDVVVNLPLKNVQGDVVANERYFQIGIAPIGSEEVVDQGQLLLVIRNITEIKKAEMRTRRILTTAQDGVVLSDEKGIITWVNPAAASMFGKEQEQLIGQSLTSFMPESYRTDYHHAIGDLVKSGSSKDFGRRRLLEGLRNDGTRFPLEIVVSGFQQESDWTFTSFLRDKTDEAMAGDELEKAYAENKTAYEVLKEKQKQLLQSEKMASIGQLAAGVAHEINNPIGYINSNMGALQRYVGDFIELIELYQGSEAVFGPHQPDLLSQVKSVRERIDLEYIKEDSQCLVKESQEGIDRVRKIVNDLKDFSHIDDTEPKEADLHQGLESTLNIVNNEIKYKARVERVYGELPLVRCIASQINQVFMNLLCNAAHSIEKQGVITLRTGVKGDEVWVEVSDTGKGIPEEKIDRIFEPFFTTKPVGVGTGLGLSVSYGIIKKHRGRIEVQSKPGEGACFRVWLPVHDAESPTCNRTGKSGQGNGGKHA